MKKIPQEVQKEIQRLIFERAYEVEQFLRDDDFRYAKIIGAEPEEIEEVALKAAIREFQCRLKEIMRTCE